MADWYRLGGTDVYVNLANAWRLRVVEGATAGQYWVTATFPGQEIEIDGPHGSYRSAQAFIEGVAKKAP